MSAHKRIEFSQEASADIVSILLDSEIRWGEVASGRYQSSLDRAVQHLGQFPEIGIQRNILGRSYRSFRVEHHVIFYRIVLDAIEIVRILHERVDPSRHL
jgi:toxin ParE1/3/4